MTVLLIPNISRDVDLSMTVKAANLLNQFSFSMRMDMSSFDDSQKNMLPSFIEPLKSMTDIDLALVFGGDGTILHYAPEIAKHSIPILCMNMGRIGFMAELNPSEIDELPNLLSSEFFYEKRMMEYIEVERNGDIIVSGNALNEVLIRNGISSKIIDLAIYSDHNFLFRVSGDGVVIATPTGSTAYSMSAGGPIADPTGEMLLLTLVCPFALHSRSFVFSASKELEVEVFLLPDRDAFISVDGKEGVALQNHDIVRVFKSKYDTRLIRFKKPNFYETLDKKLLHPNDAKGEMR